MKSCKPSRFRGGDVSLNVSNLELPKDLDAVVDTEKKCVEIQFNGDNNGQIIAYYPIDTLQVYCYFLNGTQFPDMWGLGLRVSCSGRYMRVLICEHGYGEFFEKSLKYNMSGGEFALKFSAEDNNQFSFTAENLVGVEVVLQLDGAVQDSVLLRMLENSFHTLGFSYDDFQMNQ